MRSIRNKLGEVSINVKLSAVNYDIIIFTETWLNIDISSTEIGLEDYIVYRDDRNATVASRGGGVMVAVSKRLNSSMCKVLNDDVTIFDQLFIKIKHKNRSTIVRAVYIPPTYDINVYQDHIMYVEDLTNYYKDCNFIMMGDYNLAEVKWCNNSFSFNNKTTSYTKNCCNILVNAFKNFNMLQYNGNINISDNVLDLVFSNKKSNIYKCSDELTKIDNFHPALYCEIECSNFYNNNDEYLKYDFCKYNFKKCNFIKINSQLDSIDWDIIFNELNVIDATQIFYNILYKIINDNVPKFRFKKSLFPVWFSNELKALIFNKKIMHRKYKKIKSINKEKSYEYYLEFCSIRNKCKLESDRCYKAYTDNMQKNIKKCPRTFWDFIDNKRTSREFPNVMGLNDITANNAFDISNLFAKYFGSVYTDNFKEINSNNNTNSYSEYKSFINEFIKIDSIDETFFDITVKEIENSIKLLKNSSGIGPDGVPAIFIKGCCSTIIKPLFILFNLSLRTSMNHPFWKSAYITPYFKYKGSQQMVDNYRPVAIMSAIPKMLDSIFCNKLKSLIGSLISDRQHGFMSGRSTVTNLTIFTNYLFSSIKNKSQVDAIYLDFKKAFDLVDHEVMLLKMKGYGFPHKFINWLSDYLTNRTLNVNINGTISDPFVAGSGVPQGSHLGPILFLIFINDITEFIKFSQILLFADDIKLFRKIDDHADYVNLQSDLNNIKKWCSLNTI